MNSTSRLKEVFLLVSQAPLSERESKLAQACADDPVLRQQVLDLLHADDSSDSKFGKPLLQEPGMRDSISLSGQTVGKYVLREQIGQGGMGLVYLGERSDDAYEKRIAIKIVPATVVSREAYERHRRERQFLASLEHPYIARLLDGGVTDYGALYLVMEFIDGIPLTDYCGRHQLSVPARLRIFRQVCEAVAYAHRNLVVHRDIKPANILVTTDGHPHLLDFGIAKLLTPDGEPGEALTMTGHLPMTPQYGSPEQVLGAPVTTASDVYSLGVMLYELLAGTRPYHLETRSLEEIVRVVCNQPPVALRLSAAEPVAADLEAIVMKAIRKEPEQRYGSVEALSDDLERYIERRPVLAMRGSARYRAGKFLRRNRAGVLAASLVAGTVLLGAAGTAWQAHVANQQRLVAESERSRAERQAASATLQQKRAEESAQREKTERARAERNARQADEQRRQAVAQQLKADARFRDIRALSTSFLFEFDAAITDVTGAEKGRGLVVAKGLEYLDKLQKDSTGDEVLLQEVASAYERLGDVRGNIYLSNQGKFRQAQDLYEKALSIRKHLSANHPNDHAKLRALALAHTKLADGLYTSGNHRDGISNHRMALTVLAGLRRGGDNSDETLAAAQRAHTRLCTLLISGGDLDDSKSNCDQAIAISDQFAAAHGAKPATRAGRAAAYSGLASWHRARKEYRQAAELLHNASIDFESLYRENPQNSLYSRNTAATFALLGVTWAELGERTRAIESQQKGIAVMRTMLTASPNDVRSKQTFGFTCIRLASALLAERRRTEAIAIGREGLEIFRELAEQPSATPDDYNNYATFLIDIGVPELMDAKPSLYWAKRAVAALKTPNLPFSDTLAQAYCENGDHATAVRTAETALHANPAVPGSPSAGLRADMEAKVAKYREGVCR